MLLRCVTSVQSLTRAGPNLRFAPIETGRLTVVSVRTWSLARQNRLRWQFTRTERYGLDAECNLFGSVERSNFID